MALFRTRAGYGPLESLLFDRAMRRLAGPLHAFARAQLRARLRPGMRVLDVGCGGGHVAIELARAAPSLRVVGLDLSPRMIAWARGRAADLAGRVDLVEGSAMDLPFETGSFDLVYSLGSIKHWPDPVRGLREATRVLRPGGALWLIEGDRGGRADDVDALVAQWGARGPLRPLGAAFFRLVVAGGSLDLTEARALLGATPALRGQVERAPGLPIWVLEGVREAAG